jgi:hypothetical protein
VLENLVAAALHLASSGSKPRYRFGRPAEEWCADGADDGDRAVFCEVREQTLTGVGALDVHTNGSGHVRVRAIDGESTRIRTRVRSHAETAGTAREIAAHVELAVNGGEVRVLGPHTGHREGWSVDFEIEAPRGTALALATRNGAVDVEGVAGTTTFHTSNGNVRVANAAGDVRGRTTNGHVRVELDGPRWEGQGLDVLTTNGGVVLAVPAGYSAELEASSNHGRVESTVPLTRHQARGPLRIAGTLGSGGARLSVRTTNGPVRIEPR